MSVRLVGLAGGGAAVVGGTAWVAATIIHASKPVGCVADGCLTRPLRPSGIIEGALTLVALVLFAVAATALIALTRRAGRFGRIGRTAAVLALGGIAVIVTAGLVQALLFAGDFPFMPHLVIPGVLALVAGLLLLGVTVLRAGVLPRWAAVSLVVGTLAMLGFNEQTTAAWLGIPFGLAWIAVGYALVSARFRGGSRRGRRGGGALSPADPGVAASQ